MTISWRPLAHAAVLSLIAGAGTAAGQTVMARNAQPGTIVEVVVNAAAVGSETVDASGHATIALDLRAAAGKAQIDADVYVDTCDNNKRRVHIVERGQPSSPQTPDCQRRDNLGFFLLRRVSTLVLDLTGTPPSIMLRQGEVSFDPADVVAITPPSGLVLFGGGALAQFANATAVACGNVPGCSGKDSRLAYTAGLELWFTPFVAVEAAYAKPIKVEVEGSGTGFRFDSSLDPHIVSIAGKVGIPARRARFYGKAGGNYQRAIIQTTQTNDERTVTVDGVTQTIPGGTQSFEVTTAGWSWLFGGGAEFWIRKSFGIYGEFTRAALKGSALDDEEGAIDERVNLYTIGLRIHIGR
jgi:hypothetical protein